MPAHTKEVQEPKSTQHEAWKGCGLYPADWVKVSTAGRVWFRHKGILIPYIDESGYYTVHLYGGGINKIIGVHALVCHAFHPKPKTEERLTAAHLDGNKLNNCVSNLSWVTASENRMHHEVHQEEKGLGGPRILTPNFLALVHHIKDKQWMSLRELAEVAGVDQKHLENTLYSKKNTPSVLRRQLAKERLNRSRAKARRIKAVTLQQAAAAEAQSAASPG